MSNYPPGAENDPNAPWNQEDDSLFAHAIDALTAEVRAEVANRISDWLYEVIDEYIDDYEIGEAVYDNIYADARKIWEHENI